MNEEDLKDITQIPIQQLVEYAQDTQFLFGLISLAVNYGIQLGYGQMNQSYHVMFKGYSGNTINN